MSINSNYKIKKYEKKDLIMKISNLKNKIQLIYLEKNKAFHLFLDTKSKFVFRKIVLFLYNSVFKIKKTNYEANKYLRNKFFNSWIFHVLLFILLAILSFYVAIILKSMEIAISADALSELAASIGSVIGGSVAIVFTLSTFILQSTADLFSTQYLHKFIDNKKEKKVFFVLVIFSITSFFISFVADSGVSHYHLFALLLLMSSYSFYLIFVLYKELRGMISPETTLVKITEKAILELQEIKKSFYRSARLQGFIYDYDEEQRSFLIDTQYRLFPIWKDKMLVYIKQLYEISLRLLSKNEIETTKLAIKLIHDIHKKHLELRSGNFVKVPADTLVPIHTFDDQEFTSSILEYLESYSNRIIQEKRKENINHLLRVYRLIFSNSINVDFVKNKFDKGYPIASLVLGYYKVFALNIIETKDINLIWELTKTTSEIQQIILDKNNDLFLLENVDTILWNISLYSLEDEDYQKKGLFTDKIVQIFLDRILLSWDKYSTDEIFWKRCFENLKKHLSTSVLTQVSLELSLSGVFINFRVWKGNQLNSIFEIVDSRTREDKLDKYLVFLNHWSVFLLDFSRDFGLHRNPLCLQILMDAEQNIEIINFIEDKTNKNLDQLYGTQFSTLSWYFNKVDSVEKYHSVELINLFQFFVCEIISNLKNETKKERANEIIDLYIELVCSLFEKVKDNYGFDLPRVAVKLIPLGVVLSKYNHKFEQKIIENINELNDKYLVKNKDSWKIQREKFEKVTAPDEKQLCLEIDELKNEVFSQSSVRFGIEEILSKEITKKNWQLFIEKIKCCKGVLYKKTKV